MYVSVAFLMMVGMCCGFGCRDVSYARTGCHRVVWAERSMCHQS